MSKMLWNPTNEVLSYPFGGITYSLQPGEKKKVEDGAGKHLLHNLGVRGLTVLEYDCNEEKIRKDAIERNRDFKRKQVIEYNQRNETRKQTNMAYLAPTKEVKDYAIELGMGLLEPFTPRDAEREGMARLADENKTLKDTLAELTNKLNSLARAVLNKQEAPTANAQGKEEPEMKVPKQRGA